MKSIRIERHCACGDHWSGPVPARYVAYVLQQWDHIHVPCTQRKWIGWPKIVEYPAKMYEYNN